MPVGGNYISDSLIECVSPPNSVPGPVYVEVSHDGIQFTNNKMVFTYYNNLTRQEMELLVPVCASDPNVVQLSQTCRSYPITRGPDTKDDY